MDKNKSALAWCKKLITMFVPEQYQIRTLQGQHVQRKRPLPPQAVTIYYNYGIYLEKAGQLIDAMHIYSEILKDHQDIDCYLRVGCLRQKIGDTAEAKKLYDIVIKSCKNNGRSDINAR